MTGLKNVNFIHVKWNSYDEIVVQKQNLYGDGISNFIENKNKMYVTLRQNQYLIVVITHKKKMEQ